jgi:cysteine-rich repeat protein
MPRAADTCFDDACGTILQNLCDGDLSTVCATDADCPDFCNDLPSVACTTDTDCQVQSVCRDNLANMPCSYCGDGVTDAADGEECDDGNNIDDDGCSNLCALPGEAIGCRFTGGGVDRMDAKGNRATYGGQAGANTALPPQPKGEWTHTNHKGPAGHFTFHCGTASAPVGSEVIEIRCSDPEGCKPSGDPPSPAKQLDFDCIGTFRNLGHGRNEPVFDIVSPNVEKGPPGKKKAFDGTFHFAEINVDELGEPGAAKKGGDYLFCPATGFGEKGATPLASCGCPDFYRITIHDGVDASAVTIDADGNINELGLLKSQPVIYEFHGYLDGGNLQLHHLTGFDTK